jgi:hypothetical protein
MPQSDSPLPSAPADEGRWNSSAGPRTARPRCSVAANGIPDLEAERGDNNTHGDFEKIGTRTARKFALPKGCEAGPGGQCRIIVVFLNDWPPLASRCKGRLRLHGAPVDTEWTSLANRILELEFNRIED